jgi:CDP-paratose 2-epimerase
MKRILVTGGAGFVGSNLSRELALRGHQVFVYDNLSRLGAKHNVEILLKLPNVTVVPGELDDIANFFKDHEVDLVYHFAAQVAVTTSYQNPRSDFRINALGTFNLLQCTEAPVIYASTNKVYGNNVNLIPLKELPKRYEFDGETWRNGVSEHFSIDSSHHTPYGCSKLVGDLYVREHGGVVNRFSCMYGGQQFGNEDQGWVSHFVISKLTGKPVIIYGDGKQIRDLLFVDDVVNLLILEGESVEKIRGEVFNIGGGLRNTISLIELCELLDIKPAEFKDWRPADQKVYYSDIAKAKRVLGWEPKVSPTEGIGRLMSWAKENQKLFI